jgi:predicted ATPase
MAFANHPDVDRPDSGSHAEQRLVDGYAAAQSYVAAPGPVATARLVVETGKHLWDLARILRETHPDMADADETEDES